MGRRMCRDISGDIVDNIWRYMLSAMCQNILIETVIPEVVERGADKSYRLEKQTAKRTAWMGKMLAKDILYEILDNIDTIILSSICKEIGDRLLRASYGERVKRALACVWKF